MFRGNFVLLFQIFLFKPKNDILFTLEGGTRIHSTELICTSNVPIHRYLFKVLLEQSKHRG